MIVNLREYQFKLEQKTRYTSVWLSVNEQKYLPQKFHCPICRCPIFEYIGDLVSIIPGGSPTKLPIVIKCPNRTCGKKYYVHAIVKEE